jgi:cysteine desulfurase
MALEKEGYRVTYLPVDREGLLQVGELENAITDDTAVVSLMWANNETGVLFPVADIAQVCKSRGVLYHCDAVQAAGKLPIDVSKLPVDYLSITGHKFGAPKGVGALYVQRKVPFSPYLCGGHQERGRRGGTENVALIVGLGRAAELARLQAIDFDRSVRPLRDALESGMLSSIPNVELNGHKTHRLANTVNIQLHGVDSDALLMLLDQEGICASTGSACLADSQEASHVITAMKPETREERSSLRLSLGSEHNIESLGNAMRTIIGAVATLRSI